MNGVFPWRGGREKDLLSMHAFIEASTKSRGIILDAYASTCGTFFYSHINP